MFGGGGLHLGVVEQPVDQHLAARQLEAWQLDRQSPADLAHHQLDAAAEEPAHARHQQHHQHGPTGQAGQDEECPQRYASPIRHPRLRPACFETNAHAVRHDDSSREFRRTFFIFRVRHQPDHISLKFYPIQSRRAPELRTNVKKPEVNPF
jgi:hypothetical protein